MLKVKFLIILITMFFSACSTDISMFLPQGPEGLAGNDGKSAYELWVEEVNDGNIPWNIDETDLSDFFRYLKGKDGQNGSNGQDGQNGNNGLNGQSAYELWLIEVAKGIEDPHNPGSNWDKSKTGVHDFFWFLTGKDGMNGQNGSNGQDGKPGQDGQDGKPGQDGQDGKPGPNGLSAYELWIKDVKKGLENPHDRPNEWPKNETSLDDFWRYLRGQDGAPGGPGNPGEPTPIIMGKPNVIAQFSNQSNNEYVDWVTGSVTYIVYNDVGVPVPDAVVSGIPGLHPSKQFTADGNGMFIISKDELPVDLPRSDRYGTVQNVRYLKSDGKIVTEQSAYNTYIPNKIFVRIRLLNSPYFIINDMILNHHHKFMRVDCIVERKVDPDSPWEKIPTYLGNLDQNIIAYELSNSTDPTSFTSKEHYNSNVNNISKTVEIDIERPTKRCDYIKLATQRDRLNLWDGNDHYVNIILDKYYGEIVNANSVIKLAPVQFMPLVKDLEAYSLQNNAFGRFKGSFDLTGVDSNLFFDETFLTQIKNKDLANEYILYEPKILTIGDYEDNGILRIKFTKIMPSGNHIDASNDRKLSSINDLTFDLDVPVHSESTIELHSHSQLFRTTYSLIGEIKPDGQNYKVIPSSNFEFDMDIKYTP